MREAENASAFAQQQENRAMQLQEELNSANNQTRVLRQFAENIEGSSQRAQENAACSSARAEDAAMLHTRLESSARTSEIQMRSEMEEMAGGGAATRGREGEEGAKLLNPPKKKSTHPRQPKKTLYKM